MPVPPLPDFDPAHACAFTGHRPQTLRAYAVQMPWVQFALKTVIQRAAERGVRDFISGGALGIDQMAARLVLEVKQSRPGLRLLIARPFPSQDQVWSQAAREAYAALLGEADAVVDVCPDPYAAAKLQERNVWMVDHARLLVAVWDEASGAHSGTKNCVDYALRRGKSIFLINPACAQARWLTEPLALEGGES